MEPAAAWRRDNDERAPCLSRRRASRRSIGRCGAVRSCAQAPDAWSTARPASARRECPARCGATPRSWWEGAWPRLAQLKGVDGAIVAQFSKLRRSPGAILTPAFRTGHPFPSVSEGTSTRRAYRRAAPLSSTDGRCWLRETRRTIRPSPPCSRCPFAPNSATAAGSARRRPSLNSIRQSWPRSCSICPRRRRPTRSWATACRLEILRLDGESVLVASTNNGAVDVDVAVDRANADVHPGTLLRTGNRTEREALANRVAAALATASNPMASDHDAAPPLGTNEARAELLRATDERARLLKDITTAAELNTRRNRGGTGETCTDTLETGPGSRSPHPVQADRMPGAARAPRLVLSGHRSDNDDRVVMDLLHGRAETPPIASTSTRWTSPPRAKAFCLHVVARGCLQTHARSSWTRDRLMVRSHIPQYGIADQVPVVVCSSTS